MGWAIRGVYENPLGSGIWWIHYYGGGKRHREKVGRKSDAIKLYQSRKADVVAGRKLPELRNSKVVTLSELIDDVLEFVAHHKDNRSYTSKGEIVRKALGSKPAADLTPQELERWLRTRCKTPATANRYKAFISLCYREGVRNGKVAVNPARLVRQRKEGTGRLRFLSREEYDRLHKVITARFPEHLAEFVVSVHTGMRLSEQYSCMWSQVSLCKRLCSPRTARSQKVSCFQTGICARGDSKASIWAWSTRCTAVSTNSHRTILASPVSRGQFNLNCLFCWCREGGSNPHDRKGRRILSPLRLPVPPSRRQVGWQVQVSHRAYVGCYLRAVDTHRARTVVPATRGGGVSGPAAVRCVRNPRATVFDVRLSTPFPCPSAERPMRQ